MIWSWQRSGRTPGAIALLAVLWIALSVGYAALDFHPALTIVLGVATIPALIDIVLNRKTALEVHHDALKWRSGSAAIEVPLSSDTTVSLRRRFDGGLRIVVLNGPRETRLPPELNPPAAPLEAALQQTVAEVRRDPFKII